MLEERRRKKPVETSRIITLVTTRLLLSQILEARQDVRSFAILVTKKAMCLGTRGALSILIRPGSTLKRLRPKKILLLPSAV